MQSSEENVAMCVRYIPVKQLANSNGYFSSYIYIHENQYLIFSTPY